MLRFAPGVEHIFLFGLKIFGGNGMPSLTNMTLADIDWNLLWRNARQQKSWSGKGVTDWDRKAPSFAARNAGSPYVALLLGRLPLLPDCTILDVGCGPGILALPLAARVRAVTAVDYSPGMLEVLRKKIADERVENIRTVQGAWEDDWDLLGIEQHDIAIASRSLAVEDLAAALRKLNHAARKYVFISDRIAPTPFDPGAFAAVGREFQSGPDYIYTINILYNMGIHPHVEILSLGREVDFADLDEAVQAYVWMLRDLTDQEEEALRGYLASRIVRQEDGRITISRQYPARWALIWWNKEENREEE